MMSQQAPRSSPTRTTRETSSTPPVPAGTDQAPADRPSSRLPYFFSLVAILVGVTLFVVTIARMDLRETSQYVGRLGFALPLVVLPGICWHALRTWGWSVAFPNGARPAFARLLRVRLAADALSYFTVRGLTGEPFKVLLLYDRTPTRVATASIATERLAIALVSTAVAGLISYVAVRMLAMSGAWDATFTILSIAAVLSLGAGTLIARHRTGDYIGRFVLWAQRHTGRNLEGSRVIRFVLDVEDIMLAVLRGSRARLVTLAVIPIACYAVNAFEVWLIFWVIGEPIGIMESLVIETFTRAASVAGAAVPASLGTLEASHAAVTTALGLDGGGALAVARRLRSLLWAGLGLALYPRLDRPDGADQ